MSRFHNCERTLVPQRAKRLCHMLFMWSILALPIALCYAQSNAPPSNQHGFLTATDKPHSGPLSILIPPFERDDSDKIHVLDKAGQRWLENALYQASMEFDDLRFNFIERTNLNTIIKELQTTNALSAATKAQVRASKIEFFLLVQYTNKMTPGQYLVTAKLVSADTLGSGVVNSSSSFSQADVEQGSPFSQLASQLVDRLREHFGLAGRGKHYALFVRCFSSASDTDPEVVTIKDNVRTFTENALTKERPKNAEIIPACTATDTAVVNAGTQGTIDLYVIGTVEKHIIAPDGAGPIKTVYYLIIQVVSKNNELKTGAYRSCDNPEKLETMVPSIVSDLKSGLEMAWER